MPNRSSAARCTTNFFTLLGHRIHVGRNFVEEDGTPQPAPPQGDALPAPGAQPPPPLPNIAILSYEFWQRRYGGDESIVGKSIEFGNGRADIVGVLAPNFELLFPPGTNVDPRPGHPDRQPRQLRDRLAQQRVRCGSSAS